MISCEGYWYWLNNIPGVGPRTIKIMLDNFCNPYEIYNAKNEKIFPFLKTDDKIADFVNSKNEEEIDKGLKKLSDNNIKFIYPESELYPQKLSEISDPPYGLYLHGKLPSAKQKTVAIIGARECSRYGSEMAMYFGRELAKHGVAVISGLARGIDGMAHMGALEGEGYTLGVLGGGIDVVYPKENYRLFIEMRQKGGIISESNMGVKPAAGLFPLRNRLIAGLSDGILVVEAMEKSGTFITVDRGLEQGKEIFALPGRVTDIKSAGCNNLIKLGANVVTKVNDILEILGVEYNTSENAGNFLLEGEDIKKMSLAPNEKMVYSCLEIVPKYIDCIIGETRLAPQEVSRILNELVILDVISETDRNYYAIKV